QCHSVGRTYRGRSREAACWRRPIGAAGVPPLFLYRVTLCACGGLSNRWGTDLRFAEYEKACSRCPSPRSQGRPAISPPVVGALPKALPAAPVRKHERPTVVFAPRPEFSSFSARGGGRSRGGR